LKNNIQLVDFFPFSTGIDFEKRRTEFERRRTEFERCRTEFERRRTDFERRRTEFERRRIEFERRRIEFERRRIELERRRTHFERARIELEVSSDCSKEASSDSKDPTVYSIIIFQSYLAVMFRIKKYNSGFAEPRIA
jgi:hypothetical protein